MQPRALQHQRAAIPAAVRQPHHRTGEEQPVQRLHVVDRVVEVEHVRIGIAAAGLNQLPIRVRNLHFLLVPIQDIFIHITALPLCGLSAF